MKYVTNNYIVIDKYDKDYDFLKSKFVACKREVVNNKYEFLEEKLYFEDNKFMYIPRGLLSFLQNYCDDFSYVEITELSSEMDNGDTEIYTKLSDKVVLRSDQCYMIQQILTHKRGICQAATGAGKSEVMSGLLKTFEQKLGYIPLTIVLEPTVIMVDSIIDRLSRYNIPVYRYEDIRGDKLPTSGVIVSHPMSIYNDIENDKVDLSSVKILLSDECQHLSAVTWWTLSLSLSSVEYNIGVSAKAVLGDYLEVSNYDFESAIIMGATGRLLVDIPASFYIKLGVLATPILLKINNNYTDKILNYTYQSVVKNRLYSESRTSHISKLVSNICKEGYKILVMCNTKVHAKQVASQLSSLGHDKDVLISFGLGEFIVVENSQFYTIRKKSTKNTKRADSSPMKEFEKGNYKILIGTTHIYEGLDIPNLDVVALASVGKSIRRVIQAVGRGVRITKTGKYAYVIDLSDTNDSILSRQSSERMKIFHDEVGIDKSQVYYGDVDYLVDAFRSLENLKPTQLVLSMEEV